jgi:aspartyl-tRNA(Asn)/glutamyl-tRNA(Gln) amidotransferase subunit C
MLSKDHVFKIARLASLNLSEEEATTLEKELNAILGYIEQLNKVEVRGIEPMSHVHGSTNIFREDTVQESLPFEAVEENIPDTSGRFIRVPIIIEQ